MAVVVKFTLQGKTYAQCTVPRDLLVEVEEPIFWQGDVAGCQTCQMKFGKHNNATSTSTFYDMRLARAGGRWALMCSSCALGGQGVGRVGLGYGQRYDLQEDGRWRLTAGK